MKLLCWGTKMNKKVLLLSTLLLLVGCAFPSIGSSTSSSGQTSTGEVNTPNDDDLTNFDEYYDSNTYFNRIKVAGNQEAPDPFIYRFNGKYYLYMTTGGGFIKCYESEDLVEWYPCDNGALSSGICYDYSKDPNSPSDVTPFAPELTYFNGSFYMICSPNGRGHYILESESPNGPFKAITGNIGKSIDGHFFIDKDENVYMYGASGSGIQVYEIENDFKTFTDKSTSLIDVKVGGWTEGPYLLNRHGDYYMTYCGTHYLSKNYRIDYTYTKEGEDLFKNSSYERKDTVLLSTTNSFNGLGHSSTVLGPDLDSYYIVYHNLENNSSRNLNLSRLSFNGSTMVANDVREGEITNLYSPEFSALDNFDLTSENGFLLSSHATGEDFTVEFNNIGEGKMIFSYVDNNNYSYIDFFNNEIGIYTMENGSSTLVKDVPLYNEFLTDVYHTYRLQYKDGLMNFYFDNIEKLALESAEFVPGKIGYESNYDFEEIGYTAFSNVALGSSDKKAYDSEISLANAYDDKLSCLNQGSGLSYCDNDAKYVSKDSDQMVLANENDRATYRMQAVTEGTYNINLRVPSESRGKKIGLRIDDLEIEEIQIPDSNPINRNGDTFFTLKEVYLLDGPHHISLYNVGEEVTFSQIKYELTALTDEEIFYDFTDFAQNEFFIRNDLNINNKGINSNNQESLIVATNDKYKNAIAELTFTMKQQISDIGYVALLFNVTDLSNHHREDADGVNNNNTFRGYRFEFNGSRIILSYVDHNFTNTLKSSERVNYSVNQENIITVEQNNNSYTCYFNDVEVLSITANIGNLQGSIGLQASNADASFSSLSIN